MGVATDGMTSNVAAAAIAAAAAAAATATALGEAASQTIRWGVRGKGEERERERRKPMTSKPDDETKATRKPRHASRRCHDARSGTRKNKSAPLPTARASTGGLVLSLRG